MRTLTRSILAAGAVVGLLALPVAGAGAASSGSTTASLSLTANSGTLSVTVPTGTAASPVDLGGGTVGTGTVINSNNLGSITASDTRTGLLRITTVNTATGLDNNLLAFCKDDDGDVSGGVACSADAQEQIPLASAVYNFGTVDDSNSDALVSPVATPGALGVANLANASVAAGGFEWTWNPTFDITLAGTEVAGTYYGVVQHSIS